MNKPDDLMANLRRSLETCQHATHRPDGRNQMGQWFELLPDDKVVERWEYCLPATTRSKHKEA